MVDCVASNRLLSLGRATVLLSYYYRKAMLDYCSANNRTALTDALMNLVRRRIDIDYCRMQMHICEE